MGVAGCHMDGAARGCPPKGNVEECAQRWFQDALKEAKDGDAAMQVLVAQMYQSGYGVLKKEKRVTIHGLAVAATDEGLIYSSYVNTFPRTKQHDLTMDEESRWTLVESNPMEALLPDSTHRSLYPSSPLIRRMYIGHFLARWGARMWEFSVGLYMISIWPNSLFFTALYGVVDSASSALFGSIVGALLEKLTYLQVLRLWLLTQNLSFMVAGLSVTVLLIYSGLMSTAFVKFMLLVALINISGAVGTLSTLAGTILIEREWVVVISSGEHTEALTKMNSVIRRIDLCCKLLAPVFSGFIISFVSLKASAIVLALWNVISVALQYWLLTSVYNGIPALSESSPRRSTQISVTSSSVEEDEQRTLLNKLSIIPCFDSWVRYFRQEVVLPGVALALLYFTVLSFGTLMTATLKWEGIPAYVIGLARGVSATIGIAATVVYPIVHSHISTLRTGLWSIWTQWCFLLVCVASVWISNSIISAWMLMGGVAASRLGLWMFDLAVIQQMQDHVPESDRCIVGGVQNSLQSVLDLLTYVMGIIISDPKDFGQLVLLSFFLVSSAAVLYTVHTYRVRKHLFHLDKFITIEKVSNLGHTRSSSVWWFSRIALRQDAI